MRIGTAKTGAHTCPSFDGAGTPSGTPGVGWPEAGALELRDVTLRYHLSRPRVLHGLSLRVPAGAKVAVVGRTGCGKTSLFAAISRLSAGTMDQSSPPCI